MMNKTDLIKLTAKEVKCSEKQVGEIVDAFFKEVSQTLREEDVQIKDFGIFRKVVKPAHLAKNPATGETISVPEKEIVKFRAYKNVLNMKWL